MSTSESRSQVLPQLFALATFLSAATCCLPVPVAAAADTASADTAGKNAAPAQTLEEVVITATKFKEELQSVAVAVTAINSEKLDKLGVVDVKQLDAMAPNLDIGTATEDSNAVRVTLRGVGQGTLDGASDPGVALHVDGVYLGRASALTQDLMDIDRVEVLRGPQGTLYGRNAPGGAINIITAQPNPTESFATDVLVGNYNEERVRASVNMPLTDNLLSRVAVFSDTHDGYLQNLYPGGRNPDDKDSHGGRAQLLFTDARDDTFLLRIYGEKIGGVGPGVRQLGADTGSANGYTPYFAVGIAPTTGAWVYANPFANPRVGSPAPPLPHDLFQVDEDADQFLDQLLKGTDLTMNFRINDWSNLKSLTAWESDNSNILLDEDGSPVPVETIHRLEFARQFSQEFDWSSVDNSPWKWILGAYFWHEQINEVLDVNQPPGILAAGTPLFTQPGPPGSPFVPYTPTGAFNPLGDGTNMNQNGTDDSRSYALFGQTTFPIVGPLSLTAGYRYTWDQVVQNNYGTGFFDPTDGWYNTGSQTPSAPVFTSVSYGNWGSHTSLDYALTKDNLLYASWGRGYKAGGIDFNGAAVSGTSGALERIPYLPEFLNAYEIGSKNEFLNHRLRLNLAAFYYNYKDLQTFELTNYGPRTENAAQATIRGAEAEWTWLALRNLEFDGSYGYLDARYDQFLLVGPGPGTTNYSGNYLNYSPKGTLRFGAELTTPAWSGSSIGWRADYLYKSAYFMDEANTVFDRQDGYSLINARARWTRENGKVYVELQGKNLANKQYITSELIGPPFACGCRTINVGDPMTIGLDVGFKY
jgi:iron complex outermembrane receptor protein